MSVNLVCKSTIDELNEIASQLEIELNETKRKLQALQSVCKHAFGETVYKPNMTWGLAQTISLTQVDCPGRPIAGDRWERVCSVCGFVQHTTKSKAACRKEPIFES
jgi:hypothetical protein